MAFVEELYNSQSSIDDSLNPSAVQAFRVAGTPEVAKTITSGTDSQGNPVSVPQKGDAYLGNPGTDLYCSNRSVDRINPDFSLVRCQFQRTSWQDTDPIAPGSVVLRITTTNEFVQVPRIQRKTIGAPSGSLPSYTVLPESVPRSSSVITAQVRVNSWGAGDSELVTRETGLLHNELTINTLTGNSGWDARYEVAMFMGADVSHVGKNDWRITYRWKRQGLVYELGPRVLLDGDEGIFDQVMPMSNKIPNGFPDTFGVVIPNGTFYPHTIPQVYRRRIDVPGVGGVPEVLDPVYYESPYRLDIFAGTLTNLPGLSGGISI